MEEQSRRPAEEAAAEAVAAVATQRRPARSEALRHAHRLTCRAWHPRAAGNPTLRKFGRGRSVNPAPTGAAFTASSLWKLLQDVAASCKTAALRSVDRRPPACMPL